MRKNISMKRAQSRGHSGFARVMTIVALLLTAATGAWAQEPATTYSVKMKDGTKDAKNWTITSGEKSATGDAADGLTGLSEGDQVTIQYTGRLKVKGVKATSDAAPAPSVPDGAISGVFSVSSTKKVYFSKGNLRYASSKWSFFDNQYDYYDSHSDDAWDKFGWSTSATTYGMNTSTSGGDYSGDFVDWGATMGTGWFTLSSDEWTYLFNTRTVNGGTGSGKSYTLGQSVNDKPGVVIYPDNYTGAVYSGSDWATFESAGCVFLPAAGRRAGLSVNNLGERGYYWSATPNGTNNAYGVLFSSGVLAPASNTSRYYGSSVRLVREVATSDEEQAPAAPALSITSPSVGQVIGSDGKNYAYGSLPTGVTAVAMIAKVSGTSGLAIALADEEGTMNWDTAVTTAAAHTPTFTGGTWRLPTQNEWKQMFASFGGNNASYSGLNTAITAAGGTALVMYNNYCSSTESGSNVYYAIFSGSGVDWQNGSKTLSFKVRPCLAF